MAREDRTLEETRPWSFTPHYTKYALGSVLACAGETKVLCAVNLEDQLPAWLRQSKAGHGWLSAEYSMLPSATSTRTKRERPHPSGRTQEIQRLIGRTLRGALDLKICPDLSFMVDCDVIQADGGTRTTGINGGFVALNWAIYELLKLGKLKKNPIIQSVVAISCGIKEGQILMDLDYEEDSSADADINLVLTHEGDLLEIQGTAEKKSFSSKDLTKILELSYKMLPSLLESQKQSLPDFAQVLR